MVLKKRERVSVTAIIALICDDCVKDKSPGTLAAHFTADYCILIHTWNFYLLDSNFNDMFASKFFICHDKNVVARLDAISWNRVSGKTISIKFELWCWSCLWNGLWLASTHYNDVIISDGISNTSLTIVYSTVYSKVQIKENIKAPRHWPLWWEFTGNIPRTKGPVTRKTFPLDDVIVWYQALTSIGKFKHYTYVDGFKLNF